MEQNLICYYCGSTKVIKYGQTHNKKARCKCKHCGRQFVLWRSYPPLTEAQKTLIGDLLLERIALEGIQRVLKISAYQLYTYMDKLYAESPPNLHIDDAFLQSQDIDLQRFVIENDEAWSFVGKKTNKQWIWVAMHRQSRLIVGVYIGDRSSEGAKGLWESIPETIRTKACYHTDDWEAYKKVFDKATHLPSKRKKETNHIERFWATLRQRCSRLVRLALSFSKKQQRHENAIRYFIAQYNLIIRAPLLS